jgi:hypothetical protein
MEDGGADGKIWFVISCFEMVSSMKKNT